MRPYTQSGSSVIEFLKSSEIGLSSAAAKHRLSRYGPNALPPPKRRGRLIRFLLQFHNPLIYVLLAAAAVTLSPRTSH